MILEIGPEVLVRYVAVKEIPSYVYDLHMEGQVDITLKINVDDITDLVISNTKPSGTTYYDIIEFEEIAIENTPKLYLSFKDKKGQYIKTKWMDSSTFISILESLEKIYY